MIVGGGLVGCETAHVLAEQGCKVHIVEMRDQVLKDTSYVTRHSQFDVLKSTGAALHVNTKLLKVTQRGITAEHDGKEQFIEADAVVLAMGYRNRSNLYEELQDLVKEVYQIGDFRQTRKISDAVNEGYRIGRGI